MKEAMQKPSLRLPFNEDDPNVFKIVEIEAQKQEQKQQIETRKRE